MKTLFKYFFLIVTVFSIIKCKDPNNSQIEKSSIDERYLPKPYVELKHPEWTKNATIYEVNIRQYTPEGTFNAFKKHLPRLKEMGVDMIWLMPIHPIGEKNRKGKLGSYYSVKDYYGINAEFGTNQDFTDLIKKIHEMGMHVIIDWVANHSSWDNPVAAEHPDWYTKTREGNFQSTPWRDYDDIIDFDYNQPALRKYMTDALKYWVKEFDIDGYRCDVASFVPIEFWENARKELDEIKPVFMLAESESKDLHKKAFDATYAWSLWDQVHAIATNNIGINGLTEGYIAEHVSIFPKNAYRMTFTDNHDKNSWEGNQYSNFGDGLKAAMVLMSTMDGIPMVYSGQEAGLDRSLNFFEKDPIQWKVNENEEIYRKLFRLKHKNQALWNGEWGGEMVRIKNDKMSQVIAFSREKNGDKVISIINLSNKKVTAILDSEYEKGNYVELFSEKEYMIAGKDTFAIEPWNYLVLVKK